MEKYIILAWMLLFGIAPIIHGINSLGKKAETYKKRFYIFYASILLMGSGISAFVIGMVSLISPDELQTLITIGLFSSQLLLVSIVIMSLREGENSNRTNKALSITVFIILISITAYVISQTFKAPFVYTDHRLVEDVYCPGDNLLLEFSGISDNSGRGHIISGHITNLETRQRFFYKDIFISSDNSSGVPQTFKDVPYERVIPELEPGRYIYTHSNRSGTSIGIPSSFTTDAFLIKECPYEPVP